MMDTRLYTFVQTRERTTPGVKPDVNYGLWVTMMGQRRFNSCNKGTTCWGTLLVGGGYVFFRQEVHGKISASSAQFYCEPKAAVNKQTDEQIKQPTNKQKPVF